MNDSEILDQLGNLRVLLAQSMEGIDVEDHAEILTAAAIFVAGVDALLMIRQARD